jgi:hypothetical protein
VTQVVIDSSLPAAVVANPGQTAIYEGKNAEGDTVPLVLGNLTLHAATEGSVVEMRDLSVEYFLQLEAGIVLQPAVTGDYASIRIYPEATIHLVAVDVGLLPTLSLGETEGEFDVVPG